MNDHDASSLWDRYRNAKNHALEPAEPVQDDGELSLDELEEAIAQTAASSGIPEMGIPPRAVIHPSKSRQLSRWFYRSLVVLFAILVGGLIWWGRQFYAGH